VTIAAALGGAYLGCGLVFADNLPSDRMDGMMGPTVWIPFGGERAFGGKRAE
jgi:hypothetical protein